MGNLQSLLLSVDIEKASDVAKNMKNLLLLGAVCRAWRSFAWSLPQLWTTISVNVYNEHKYVSDMINQWVGRSDKLVLHVYLYTEPGCRDDDELSRHPYGNEPYIAPLMHVINACSERWFYLNLILPKRFMQQVYCSNMGAPMLETLTLQLLTDDIEDPFINSTHPIYIGETPNLRKVNLSQIILQNIVMDWESITRVHAEHHFYPTQDMGIEFLRAAPALTHLTLYDGFAYEGLTSILRHRNLTYLQLNGDFLHDGPDEFLALLDLPVLEELDIFATSKSSLKTLDNFLQRSSCILKKFHLNIADSWMENKEQIIILLEKMPYLELLELKCQYYYLPSSDEFPPLPQLPTLTVIQEMKSTNKCLFLPYLKKVHTKVECHAWSSSLDLRLHPNHSRADSPSGSDGNNMSFDTLHLTPLSIYYLLDPATQRKIQPVIESCSSGLIPPAADLHPIMEFLRQSLYRYTYEYKDGFSSFS